jgi:hypothetical protein
MLPYLVIIIEFTCFSLAFLFLRKANDWWRIFMPYLGLVLFTETVGLFHSKNGNNYWVYNLYLAVYFLISFFILSKICASLFRIKPYFLIGLGMVGLTYFTESIWSHFKGLSIRSYSLANAFIVIVCCSYYYHLQQTFTLGKGYSAEVSGWFNGNGLEGTWKQKPIGSMDIGVQKRFWNEKANLKLSLSDVFNTIHFRATSDYGGTYMDINQKNESRILRLNFTYRFGSNQIKEARQHKTALDSEGSRIKK